MPRLLQIFVVLFFALLTVASGLAFANLSQSGIGQALPVPQVPVLTNEAVQALPLLPARGPVTSNFGWRSDHLNGNQKFHAGLDIGAPHGAPVYVTQGGIIAYSGERGGYGQVVVVQHHPQFYTLYAHLSERFVAVGQRVEPGQTIARVGATGRVTGPHLHFETILNQQVADPVQYLTYLNQHPPISPKVYLANMQRPAGLPVKAQSDSSSEKRPVVINTQPKKTAPTEKTKVVNVKVPLPVPNNVPQVIRRLLPSSISAPVPIPGLS